MCKGVGNKILDVFLTGQAECDDSRFVVKWDNSHTNTQCVYCYFTGYILPPACKTDVKW